METDFGRDWGSVWGDDKLTVQRRAEVLRPSGFSRERCQLVLGDQWVTGRKSHLFQFTLPSELQHDKS